MNTIAQLGQLRNVPVDMTLSSLSALNRGQHQEELGLQDMMRQQQFNHQADPMRLQQMSTANETGLQTLHQMKRNNREADELSPYKLQAELVGYLAKAKQGDIDMAVSRLQEMAMSQDPNIAQQGRFLLQGTKDFLMQKMKDEAAMARTRQQGANQLAVSNVGAESRERVAALAAAAKREMSGLKTPKDWQEYAVRKQLELVEATTAEEQAALQNQIVYAQTMAERLRPPQQVMNPEMTGGAMVDPRGNVPTPQPQFTGKPRAVNNQAEYEALPDGAPYIWNGKQYFKGQK